MSRLPEDLVQYVRANNLGRKHKTLIRELAAECRDCGLTVPEYVARYVKRAIRIARALEGPEG